MPKHSIKNRCRWCGKQPLYQEYHDFEWGKPHKNEQALLELFFLETQHAGLSWWTVLAKRDNYRQAFHQFNVNKIVKMTKKDIEHLLQNEGLIRNRLKIEALIHNAKTYQQFQLKNGSFVEYFWGKVNHQPILNMYNENELSPVTSELSNQIAKEFKKFGFKFFGSTTAYAFLQAAGIINDHLAECDLGKEKHAISL